MPEGNEDIRAVAQIAGYMQAAVLARRSKVWTRAAAELPQVVGVFNRALGVLTGGKVALDLKVGEKTDVAAEFQLVLRAAGRDVHLEYFSVRADGCYPVTARSCLLGIEPAEVPALDALTVRILNHFSNPQSALIELLAAYCPA
jgi:hypothetical protein